MQAITLTNPSPPGTQYSQVTVPSGDLCDVYANAWTVLVAHANALRAAMIAMQCPNIPDAIE